MFMQDDEQLRVPGSALRAYLELLRIPNVFTAVADVMMGYLVVNRSFDPAGPMLVLIGVSACLYLAGMVYNDLFDCHIDAIERPERPIPSGRVSIGAVRVLGATLLCVGLALSGQIAWQVKSPWPFAIAWALAILVLFYDKWLKHTPVGPLAMGGCRTLNVLMGMSGAVIPLRTMDWIIAVGLGVYVVGVTIFARKEAGTSGRGPLVAGLLVMLGGMGLIVAVPWFVDDWRLGGLDQRWPLFWALLAAHLIWRCSQAIIRLDSFRVRVAVTNAIMSIIVIDAAASLAGAGVPLFSFAILVLIIPATFLGRWIYST
jgi:hypothetical protein